MYGRRQGGKEREAQRRTAHLNSFVRSARGQNVPNYEGSRPSHPLGGWAKEPVLRTGGGVGGGVNVQLPEPLQSENQCYVMTCWEDLK